MAKQNIDKPEMQPVELKGEVNKKSKGLLGDFIQEDAKTIGKSIVDDILKPTIKDLIFNGFKTALEMALWGESTGGYTSHGRTGNRVAGGSTAYDRMYTNRTPAVRVKPHNQYQPVPYTFDEMFDAQQVLAALSDRMDTYGCFSMADYYRCCRKPYDYTDNDWGWNDMRGIQIVHVAGGGWAIDFPDAIHLGK